MRRTRVSFKCWHCGAVVYVPVKNGQELERQLERKRCGWCGSMFAAMVPWWYRCTRLVGYRNWLLDGLMDHTLAWYDKQDHSIKVNQTWDGAEK